jgi:hypothetical protein
VITAARQREQTQEHGKPRLNELIFRDPSFYSKRVLYNPLGVLFFISSPLTASLNIAAMFRVRFDVASLIV